MVEWIEAHPVVVGLGLFFSGQAAMLAVFLWRLQNGQAEQAEAFIALKSEVQAALRGVEQKVETHAAESRHQLTEARKMMQELDRVVTKHEEKIRATREVVDGHDDLAERFLVMDGTVATKAELSELRGSIDSKFSAIMASLGEIRGEMRARNGVNH